MHNRGRRWICLAALSPHLHLVSVLQATPKLQARCAGEFRCANGRYGLVRLTFRSAFTLRDLVDHYGLHVPTLCKRPPVAQRRGGLCQVGCLLQARVGPLIDHPAFFCGAQWSHVSLLHLESDAVHPALWNGGQAQTLNIFCLLQLGWRSSAVSDPMITAPTAGSPG